MYVSELKVSFTIFLEKQTQKKKIANHYQWAKDDVDLVVSCVKKFAVVLNVY